MECSLKMEVLLGKSEEPHQVIIPKSNMAAKQMKGIDSCGINFNKSATKFCLNCQQKWQGFLAAKNPTVF